MPSIHEDQELFDTLHGLLNCVKDQFVYNLNDIAANNPKLLLEGRTLVDALAAYEYLSELLVVGWVEF